jgi:23S rRNA pseudouridine955/2504/2580 synthase
MPTISPEFSDMRLDRYLRGQFGVTQGWIEKALRKGEIRLDGKRAEAKTRTVAGQELTLPPLPDLAAPAPKVAPPVPPKLAGELRAAIIKQTADWIAVNKPAGIASQGGSKVRRSMDKLAAALVPEGTDPPRLVHRLDKDTSGVFLMAKTSAAARKLTDAFKSREMEKCYLAITVGVPLKTDGTYTQRLMKKPTPHGGEMVQVDPKGQTAVTDYRVLDTLGKKYALVALWPKTGRTHQLRVHLAHHSTPILGDAKYGDGFVPETHLPDGMMLHAWQLSWPDLPQPIVAPIPPAFRAAMDALGLNLPVH